MYYNEAASPALPASTDHGFYSSSESPSWVSGIPFFPHIWKMNLDNTIPCGLFPDQVHQLHLSTSTMANGDEETCLKFISKCDLFFSQKFTALEELTLNNIILTDPFCNHLRRFSLNSLSLEDCDDYSDSFRNLSNVKTLSITIKKRLFTKIHVPQGVEKLSVNFIYEKNGTESPNDIADLSISTSKCSRLKFL